MLLEAIKKLYAKLYVRMPWRRRKSASSESSVFFDPLGITSDFSLHDSQGSATMIQMQPDSVLTRKQDNSEVFREAVDKLVDKLERINDNLSSQIRQNERLVERMDSIPTAVQDQREAFALVAEQLQQKVARDERIAEELIGIHEKVAQTAETDARMNENLSMFSETLRKLDADTLTQTEWLQQMSQTFSAGERYIKYTIAKQQVRFYWVFGIALGVCLFVIMSLIIGIALLTHR